MMTEERRKELIDFCENVLAAHVQWGGDSDEEDLYRFALAALTQPASPAYFINRIEFTDAYGPDVELRAYESELDASKSKGDHGGDIIPVYLNAPHTAPIEPICATGGVKVPEGWSLVPNEATREMIEEGDQWELSENIWNAMLGVAPKP